ncbi:hypothetical protein K1719_013479 [Acacia pycnantha]|nr:hypothetical protein K1719_013479 [Acacia pycnantha]
MHETVSFKRFPPDSFPLLDQCHHNSLHTITLLAFKFEITKFKEIEQGWQVLLLHSPGWQAAPHQIKPRESCQVIKNDEITARGGPRKLCVDGANPRSPRREPTKPEARTHAAVHRPVNRRRSGRAGILPWKLQCLHLRRRNCKNTWVQNARRTRRTSIRATINDVQTVLDPAPVQVTWQIVVGAIAGVTPFVVAGVEFSKRIISQKTCEECGGSGLVLREKEYFRCPECGGFLPWQSWKRFFSG